MIVKDLLICGIKYLRASWGQEQACNMAYMEGNGREHLWASTGRVTFLFFLGWSLVRKKLFWCSTAMGYDSVPCSSMLGSAFSFSHQNTGIRQLTHWSPAHVVLHFCVILYEIVSVFELVFTSFSI